MDEEVEILAMSDEDFLKMSGPASVEKEEEAAPAVEAPVVEETQQPEVVQESIVEPVVEESQTQNEEVQSEVPPETKEQKTAPEVAPVVEEPVVEEPDYKAFYELAMKPIKANGKEIQLKNPQELLQLAQMGANYTKKMQDIAPQRKLLLMLENNGLLDESKLSYLIDLDKKNPEAIKKLIADAGVNPLDIDTTVEPAYVQGNHRVTDEEATFRSVLDDVSGHEDGQATLQAINSTWDQASKEQLYKQPDILNVMVQQRQAGIYDRVVNEMARQQALGYIPAGQTWLQSYQRVGEYLAQNNGFDDLVANQPVTQQTPPKPVATTVAAPKVAVAPNAKVAAASPSRATPAAAKTLVNPLSLSDEDFLKQMSNRL